MKKYAFVLCLTAITFSSFVKADDVVKASELSKPAPQDPNPEAQKKAHKRVEKRKAELKEKIKDKKSAQEIGKKKAQLQVDRIEANRQDYLNQQNSKTESTQEKGQ